MPMKKRMLDQAGIEIEMTRQERVEERFQTGWRRKETCHESG